MSMPLSSGVADWWATLCGVGALNILAWSLTAATLRRRRQGLSFETYAACRLQLVLSAVYVFGCAFRSALPVYDIPRVCLVNIWLSSVVVGRSVATLAELCFVAQWALMLGQVASVTRSGFARVVSRLIVPLILIAEGCSWYAVLTTTNLGHVAEESLWGVSAALMVASLACALPRCPRSLRPLVIVAGLVGTGYVGYMFGVDVPMYWSRWLAELASGHHDLGLLQGLFDVSEHRVVSFRWQTWRTEVTWMTLYFSVAVWMSISLIHVALRYGTPARRPGTAQLVR
ncbi:MAG TPA: hypothetical protein VME21_09630 [Steroidobacteraceae bacterium]|nr:hypothetical protein [Steroidobacteraceae bacterium]